jgi:aconitate hydratase
MKSIDSFKTKKTLHVKDKAYDYFSLKVLEEAGYPVASLPHSLKILLENLIRYEDGQTVLRDDILALLNWPKTCTSDREIAYRPTRVLMQDFTGVPAVVDLGAMRDAMKKMGGNPEKINPLSPVDLVIDHSIQVDEFASVRAMEVNAQMEMERNRERYAFLRWGQEAFNNFRVVPPDTGICHQVNLEYLAKTIWHHEDPTGARLAYPDTLVGTDSHTTMINGLGVLGWGVGGIEAEAAMLGQPISMLIPEVIGVKLTGQLREGVTATDLVLTITQLLRKKGVVGKFVEYYGPGVSALTVADRATIGNMSPEYGATCGFFPIDEATLTYLRFTGRDEETVALVETYAKAQGLWFDAKQAPLFTDTVALDLSTVAPSLAGPKRPQDRLELPEIKQATEQLLADAKRDAEKDKAFPYEQDRALHHGDVVIAAITSCTNTSNPDVLMAAGLVAKKALEKGLKQKPWVKTSLAPGSQVVTQYLNLSGLQAHLDQLGFGLVGYGCTTCIGNSGPLPDPIAQTVSDHDLIVSAVLSGNRNFEGRIHPQVKANWLASPPLVVAFALAGTTRIDLTRDPLGQDHSGKPVYLKDIWPSRAEIEKEVSKVKSHMFKERYADVFTGDEDWQSMAIPESETYHWEADSTYIQHPPFFADMSMQLSDIKDVDQANILALLGDSITTDHISPAGSIKPDSPAGKYLQDKGVAVKDFNSYGARRGNHEVMMRGTFANIRIRNEMVPGIEGGITKHIPSGEVLPIYDAAMRYQEDNVPLVIIAGKEYGTGSSRDWAAKGPKLLGIRAIIAEGFERIHRSNLIGMGIIPLQFQPGVTRHTLKLDGSETISIMNLNNLKPGATIDARIHRKNGDTENFTLLSRIDTHNEIAYYKHGGILQYVMRQMLSV